MGNRIRLGTRFGLEHGTRDIRQPIIARGLNFMHANVPVTCLRLLLGLGLLLTSLVLWAAGDETSDPSATPALTQEQPRDPPPPAVETPPERVYSFGVVPQQAATRLARMWVPLLQRVQALSGVPLKFDTAKDIPTFEQGLAAGRYDFAYMNPYHFVVFNAAPGYRALARDRDQRIQGIMVVAQEAPFATLEDLANRELVFPAPGAFAASILTRAELERRGIPFQARFVASHDSVYLNVAGGHFAAGGGIPRNLAALNPELRGQLRVLWATPDFTPHAIAVSPQVPERDAQAVGQALVALTSVAPELLQSAALGPLTRAQDSDWDDIRALDIDRLRRLSQLPTP